MKEAQKAAGGFDAGDMTSAAAVGFRDGQVSARVLALNGIVLREEWFDKGLAKLSATGEQLPADAADHAIVYDPITGLMESIRAPGFDVDLSPDEAAELVAKLSFAGYNDWIVPNVPEAVHSVDYTRHGPAADLSLYPDAVGDWHLTSQQTHWTEGKAGSARSFFFVGMSYGDVNDYSAGYRFRVRPVRRARPAGQ